MHEKLLESLSGKILGLMPRLHKLDPDWDSPKHPIPDCALIYYGHLPDTPSFAVNHRDAEHLRNVVVAIKRRAPRADRISEQRILDELASLLQNLLRDEAPTGRTEAVAHFFAALASLVEPVRVFIPVFGLDLRVDDWEVGHIKLVNVVPPEVPPAGWYPGRKLHGVYALFETEGDDEYAKEAARDAARRAMDLLRFCVAMATDKPWCRRIISLEDEFNPQPENRSVTIMPKSGLREMRSPRLDSASPRLVPWVVTPEVIAHLQDIALGGLTPLLKRPFGDLNSFQQCVIRAVHWMADSQMQIETENRLLSLVTAMEALFTRKDGSPISNAIAEGVAFVAGGDAAEMRETKKLVRRLYNLRSTLSHGGEAEALRSDVELLLRLCRKVMAWMLEKLPEFPDQEALVDWIEDQKFSIPPPVSNQGDV